MSTRYFRSPAAFGVFLTLVPGQVRRHQARALERAARLLERKAKATIGDYQPAAPPFGPWPPLAPRTLTDKYRGGWSPPDNPLLRTGQLRASISHEVGTGSEAGTAVVGSDEDVAVYQELGTRNMPPRSFLGSAAAQNADAIARILGRGAVAALVNDFDDSRVEIDLP